MILISGTTLITLSTLAFAQKSSNVQEDGLWASVPVKVDGKTTDETFKASNKSTMLSYTMSNDDKNIYLVMKSADNINNNKIMMGGITLTINTEGKKKEKEAASLTYPVIARPQRGQGGRGQGGGFGGGQGGGFGQRNASVNMDSVARVRRKQQLAAAKEIKVLNFKDVTDTLISIYNEYEILAVANFDDQGAFVYELAIPLKLLGLSSSSKDFAYNIKINGRQFGGGATVMIVERPGGGGFGGGQGGGGRGGFDPSAFLPTDFWGKYTLIVDK